MGGKGPIMATTMTMTKAIMGMGGAGRCVCGVERVAEGCGVSDYEPLVVVHGASFTFLLARIFIFSADCVTTGPRRIGKTRTISIVFEEWGRCRKPVWVIAQSNVGVKNIARTLIKQGVDFKSSLCLSSFPCACQ